MIALIVYRGYIKTKFANYFQQYYDDPLKTTVEKFIAKAKDMTDDSVNTVFFVQNYGITEYAIDIKSLQDKFD